MAGKEKHQAKVVSRGFGFHGSLFVSYEYRDCYGVLKLVPMIVILLKE